jgi:hypothetical protein
LFSSSLEGALAQLWSRQGNHSSLSFRLGSAATRSNKYSVVLFWSTEAPPPPPSEKARTDWAERANRVARPQCGAKVACLDPDGGFSINVSTRQVSTWRDWFHERVFLKTLIPTNLLIQTKVETRCLE